MAPNFTTTPETSKLDVEYVLFDMDGLLLINTFQLF